jgi:SAM-dependent methyltransferase
LHLEGSFHYWRAAPENKLTSRRRLRRRGFLVWFEAFPEHAYCPDSAREKDMQPENPESFAEWNEQMVRRFDPERFYQHPARVVRRIASSRLALALRWLQLKPEHAVLDVGCGGGQFLKAMRAARRVGLDLSPSLTARAREALADAAEIIEGDAEELPFVDASFERVLCSSVLNHVYRPERVMAEAWRVLKPGGRLVVTVSCERSIENGLRLARWLRLDGWLLGGQTNTVHDDVYAAEYHLRPFDRQRLLACAKELPRPTRVMGLPWYWTAHVAAAFDKAR